MNESPWKPAWIPKQADDEVTPEEARRRVSQHVQEAKIALEEDKREMKQKALESPLENNNDNV